MKTITQIFLMFNLVAFKRFIVGKEPLRDNRRREFARLTFFRRSAL
ncbi:hypothetical protein CSSP291_01005 [Cronobacter sakazakii SP291]|uniref:Uncharacterized protein n=1 Tax=Cronobacter sakazakii (strain ATCC BAA-894) TaxID=290339 RepID=A7MM57_CROS8|nr:hypothetical protein ESA_00226 [Cronobacter sakazakii ATCC BAA-894]AGE84801.1 hypothetical protein CSSP291_01005 [Cronobacter sakazakii SP291]EGL71969.1 hypothetical protein CSE899_14679 [Cronobacter sakazakii E899]